MRPHDSPAFSRKITLTVHTCHLIRTAAPPAKRTFVDCRRDAFSRSPSALVPDIRVVANLQGEAEPVHVGAAWKRASLAAANRASARKPAFPAAGELNSRFRHCAICASSRLTAHTTDTTCSGANPRKSPSSALCGLLERVRGLPKIKTEVSSIVDRCSHGAMRFESRSIHSSVR